MADKSTLGLTPEMEELMTEIVEERKIFKDAKDAAKFALAISVNRGIPAGEVEGTSTKWNIGTIDPGGEVASLLTALYPEASESYRLFEHFVHEGLRIMGQELATNGELDLVSLMNVS